MGNKFTDNRVEYFEYELFAQESGLYRTQGNLDIVKSATVNFDFERKIIGNAKFILKDNGDIDFLSDKIKPKYCIVHNGITYKYPLGYYSLEMPEKNHDIITERQVNAFDKLLFLEQKKLSSSLSVYASDVATDEIEYWLYDIFSESSDWDFLIEPSTETFAENMTFKVGTSFLDMINAMLKAINYYPLFATGNGTLICKPWTNVPNITYEFLDDSESVYKTKFNEYKDYVDMYNRVIVLANQLEADTEPIVSTKTFESYNLDNHPLSYTSLGRYIDKVFPSEATSQATADNYAKKLIYKMLEVDESIDFEHAFVTNRDNDGVPHFGDCYKFRNLDKNIDATYIIKSMTYDLKAGNMVNSLINKISFVEE